MTWYLTVIAADGQTLLFAGNTHDRAEAMACAAEAKRRRPSAKVLVRDPFQRLYEWRVDGLQPAE